MSAVDSLTAVKDIKQDVSPDNPNRTHAQSGKTFASKNTPACDSSSVKRLERGGWNNYSQLCNGLVLVPVLSPASGSGACTFLSPPRSLQAGCWKE